MDICLDLGSLMALLTRGVAAQERTAAALELIAASVAGNEQLQKLLADVKGKTAEIGGALNPPT